MLTLGSFIRDSSLAGFPALNDTAVIRRPSHNVRVRPRAAVPEADYVRSAKRRACKLGTLRDGHRLRRRAGKKCAEDEKGRRHLNKAR